MRLACSLWLWCALLVPTIVSAAKKTAPFPTSPILYAGVHQRGMVFPMTSASVDVYISGIQARTSVTMTFHNPYKNVLPGEMIYPLPEGAVIRRYGIDVGGRLVDSSVVEKEKARLSFDEEVSKNIDPGFVEHVTGSIFRTYVWPMTPKRTRTVRIEYTQQLSADGYESLYRLPLQFKHASGPYRLKVQVVNTPNAATVRQGPEGFELIDRDQGQEGRWERITPHKTEDLVIAVPTGGRSLIAVEQTPALPDRFGKPADVDAPKETYFVISDLPRPPIGDAGGPEQGWVGLLWDASLSRARSSKAKEFELIRRWAKKIQVAEVELMVFRNRIERPRSFTIVDGNAEELIKALHAVRYDG